MSNGQLEMGNGGSGRPSTSGKAESPRYEQLDAWKYADDLAVEVYKLTRQLPPDVKPVAGQILRAAISVPANIAEGYGRGSDKEFLQFLTIANASLYEVGYFVHFLRRIEAITSVTYERVAADCSRGSRVLFGLMKSVRSGTRTGQRRFLASGPKGREQG